MKPYAFALALASLPFAAPAADLGVSVTVGQPGFYGHIDIGNVPHPPVTNPEPVVVHPTQTPGKPIYLRVPPGHARHWEKHCSEYDACTRRVYFVTDDWYNNVYVPDHQARHPESKGAGERRDAEHGKGKGHGNGHGRKE